MVAYCMYGFQIRWFAERNDPIANNWAKNCMLLGPEYMWPTHKSQVELTSLVQPNIPTNHDDPHEYWVHALTGIVVSVAFVTSGNSSSRFRRIFS